jgi:hypothetical protein
MKAPKKLIVNLAQQIFTKSQLRAGKKRKG